MVKVSIIIPYKEDRGYLDEAIKSVEDQTYPNIELIESRSNNGVSYNLNRGIEHATGDFIKYLCDDDRLTPNSVEDSLKAIQGHDFIHGNSYILFDGGKTDKYIPQYKRPTLKDMVYQNRIHGGTLMYRADVFERFGLFDESLWTGEEYDFNMMLLSKGATLGYCNSFLYYYRRHDNQKSLGKKANQFKRKSLIKQIRKRYV